MEDIKKIYELFPYIMSIALMLNIIGNMIKMTFGISSKYIVWILLGISVAINILFFGINLEGLFIGFLSFSFSVSAYDLVKCFIRIKKNKLLSNGK